VQREIARLSRVVAMLAVGIGVVFFVAGQALGLPFWQNFLFAIGIIVANVPEGLLPTVTLSLAMATQRMAKRNALVRHLPAVEALGSTTVICCDQDRHADAEPDVGAARVAGWRRPRAGRPRCEPGTGAAQSRAVRQRRALPQPEGGSEQRRAAVPRRPMEVALADMGRQRVGALDGYLRVEEMPFDTDRMRMSVVCDTPTGRALYCKGAPESVLAACAFVQFDAGIVPLDAAAKTRLLATQDQMTTAGLRVLAFAHCALADGAPAEERGMLLTGLVGLEDPPRPEVPGAIARCEAAGVRVVMVTGITRARQRPSPARSGS